MSLMRVLLFTPATHTEYIDKAANSGTDGVIIDLEDGVALEAKDTARANLLALLAKPRAAADKLVRCVRLNHIATRAGLADLLALADAADRLDAIMLPKVESPHEVELAARHLAIDSPRIVALIESGRGLEQAAAIASHPLVAAIAANSCWRRQSGSTWSARRRRSRAVLLRDPAPPAGETAPDHHRASAAA